MYHDQSTTMDFIPSMRGPLEGETGSGKGRHCDPNPKDPETGKGSGRRVSTVLLISDEQAPPNHPIDPETGKGSGRAN